MTIRGPFSRSAISDARRVCERRADGCERAQGQRLLLGEDVQAYVQRAEASAIGR